MEDELAIQGQGQRCPPSGPGGGGWPGVGVTRGHCYCSHFLSFRALPPFDPQSLDRNHILWPLPRLPISVVIRRLGSLGSVQFQDWQRQGPCGNAAPGGGPRGRELHSPGAHVGVSVPSLPETSPL